MRLYEITNSLQIPRSNGNQVKTIQLVLKSLPKYRSVPVDGILSPAFANIIKLFQQDHDIEPTGIVDQTTINQLYKEAQVHNIQIPSMVDNNQLSQLPINSDIQKSTAKSVAEQFIGRPLDDVEWDWLVRATIAEASRDPEEQANVAGVILNRSRNSNTNIISVLKKPNQFQSVTGKTGSSTNFLSPTIEQIQSVLSAIQTYMPKITTRYNNFTAVNLAAYGPNSNMAWRERGKNTGVQIGQTFFFI